MVLTFLKCALSALVENIIITNKLMTTTFNSKGHIHNFISDTFSIWGP